MKVLFASDIHGSYYYAQKLVEEFKNGSYDKLVLLGDILYHGPRNDLPLEYNPKKVIPMLNEIKNSILCINGNCDAEVDQMVLEFPIIKEGFILVNGITYYLTHGHIHNPSNPLNLSEGVVLYGHTHVIKDEVVNGVHYINPGSTSIPKQIMHHSFGVIEENTVKVFDLETKEELLKVVL